MSEKSGWFVYMVRTADGSLYTGVTTDVQRRFAEHQAAARQSDGTATKVRPNPKGAKYFRGKKDLRLVLEKAVADRSMAQKLEYKIKQLAKSDKEALATGALSFPDLVAETNG